MDLFLKGHASILFKQRKSLAYEYDNSVFRRIFLIIDKWSFQPGKELNRYVLKVKGKAEYE